MIGAFESPQCSNAAAATANNGNLHLGSQGGKILCSSLNFRRLQEKDQLDSVLGTTHELKPSKEWESLKYIAHI